MSDARLRELERQAATGDLEARARLLLERERLGHLTRARLELAAHAGEPAAGRALGVTPPDDAVAWARGFHGFGQEACVRVVAAAVTTLLERGPSLLRRAGAEQLAPLHALRPWLACPCEEHAGAAIRLARQRAFELPSLPGVVLGLDWVDGAPACLLRAGLTREEAEAARRQLETSRGAAEVALDASGQAWCVRLRERFPIVEKVVLVRDVRAVSGFGLADALGAVEGVNAVVRVLHDATQALGREALRDAIVDAILPASTPPSEP